MQCVTWNRCTAATFVFFPIAPSTDILLSCSLINAARQRALGHVLRVYQSTHAWWYMARMFAICRQEKKTSAAKRDAKSFRPMHALAAKMTSGGGFTLHHVTPSSAARCNPFCCRKKRNENVSYRRRQLINVCRLRRRRPEFVRLVVSRDRSGTATYRCWELYAWWEI